MPKTSNKKKGFALIEILVAITILSIALLGIMTGVSSGVVAIAANQDLTRAMLVANSKLNEFLLDEMKGTDIQKESVKEYPGFSYSRNITRYEHQMFGPIDAQKVEITVYWQDRHKEKSYSISYIYAR